MIGPVAAGLLVMVAAGGLGTAAAGTQCVAPSELPVSRIDDLTGPVQPPAVQPVSRVSSRAELDAPRTLSIRLPRPTPVRAVVQLLLRGTPLSTVVHASVRGSFAGELRNLTLRQALEAVLFALALDYELHGTVVRIFPRQPTTRIFSVDLVSVRRSWRSEPEAPGVVASAVATDGLQELDRGIAALLSQQGRHYVDRHAGVVHVTDFGDRLDRVGLYLETVQLRARRQVRLDVRVYRLDAGDLDALATVPSIAPDRQDVLRRLQAAAAMETLAATPLLAMNNQPAMVRVRSADGLAASLVVTPQISADGFVQISVVPRLTHPLTTGGEPAASTLTESDIIVRVRAGETVLLPALPSPSAPGRRTALLVLLTPSLVGSHPSSTGR